MSGTPATHPHRPMNSCCTLRLARHWHASPIWNVVCPPWRRSDCRWRLHWPPVPSCRHAAHSVLHWPRLWTPAECWDCCPAWTLPTCYCRPAGHPCGSAATAACAASIPKVASSTPHASVRHPVDAGAKALQPTWATWPLNCLPSNHRPCRRCAWAGVRWPSVGTARSC